MQESESLAQIIVSVVDALQDTKVGTDIAVSTHDWPIDKQWKYHIQGIMIVMIQTGQVSEGYVVLEQLRTLKHVHW